MKFKNKEEVHNKALGIINKKQKDLRNELGKASKGDKNMMGDLFEEWFGKTKDSASIPDLGVSELKATPFKRLKKTKNGKAQYTAKERLVLNIIDYNKLADEDFEHSHFLYKNKILEIAFYEYIKDIPKDDWFFQYVILYQMMKSPVDFQIIKNDWLTIQKFVLDGRAEDISESATNYLAACTKGANKNSLRTQPYSPTNAKAKQRAFSFKASFMKNLLVEYVIGDAKTPAVIKDKITTPEMMNATKAPKKESLIKDPNELEKNSLEQVIENRFKPYIGMNQDELMRKFHIESKAKSKNNILARAILKLDNKNRGMEDVEEFNKASIVPKTIQFNEHGSNKESMSLPYFKFMDLVKEDWVNKDGETEAELNTYLSESKFLFIVFQDDGNGNNVLRGIKLYSIPEKEIDGPIKEVWQDTKNKLETGIKLSYDSKRDIVHNDLIGIGEHMIIHVRPHTSKTSYVDNNYSNKLPHPAIWTNKPDAYSNEYLTTQSFWLNGSYIKKVVSDLLNNK